MAGKDGPQQETASANGQPQLHAKGEGLTAVGTENDGKASSQTMVKNADPRVIGPKGKTRMNRRPADPRKASDGMLDRSLQAQLGRQLRAIYSGVEEEPVPERFVILLEELERKEKRK